MARRNPNPVQRIGDTLERRVRKHIPEFEVLVRQGFPHEFPAARNFAYCMDTRPPTIVYAPKLAWQDEDRVTAVLAHEMGHAALFRANQPEHTEREADVVAEALFGVQIHYDADTVQSLRTGVRPRPGSLPR